MKSIVTLSYQFIPVYTLSTLCSNIYFYIMIRLKLSMSLLIFCMGESTLGLP